MKKLMIAAAIFCAAAMSQAAALNWSTWGYTGDNPDEGLLDGSSAYLVMVTDAATFAVADDLSITGGVIVDTAKFSEGVIGATWNTDLADGNYLFAIIGTTAGDGMPVPTKGLYGIDYNGANETESGFYEIAFSSATGADLFYNEESFGGLAANTAVVPEPTSGLLLLLGMAGLALRRKQA